MNMTVKTIKPTKRQALTTKMESIILNRTISESNFLKDMEKLFEDAYTLGYYDGIEDTKKQDVE